MKKSLFIFLSIVTSLSICEEPKFKDYTSTFKNIPNAIRSQCVIIELCASINSNVAINKACGRINNLIYCSQNSNDKDKEEFCGYTSPSPVKDMMIIQEELNLDAQVIIDCLKAK